MSVSQTAIFLPASDILINGLVAIAVFIAPLWLILQYVAKFRANRHLNAADIKAFEQLNQLAARMESRMLTLERILDAEVPSWRQTNDLGVRDHEAF